MTRSEKERFGEMMQSLADEVQQVATEGFWRRNVMFLVDRFKPDLEKEYVNWHLHMSVLHPI